MTSSNGKIICINNYNNDEKQSEILDFDFGSDKYIFNNDFRFSFNVISCLVVLNAA